jgi:hypothetical protein
MRRQRILVLGEILLPSGYATVLQNLLPFLEDLCEIHVFARSYSGPPRAEGWTVHPNAVEGDVWGVEQVPVLLDRIRPDLVWVIYDCRSLSGAPAGARKVADGSLLPDRWPESRAGDDRPPGTTRAARAVHGDGAGRGAGDGVSATSHRSDSPRRGQAAWRPACPPAGIPRDRRRLLGAQCEPQQPSKAAR